MTDAATHKWLGAARNLRRCIPRIFRSDADNSIPFRGVLIGLAIMLPIYAAIALALALSD